MRCMQLLSLSGRKQNDWVRTKGKIWKGRHMVVRFVSGPPRHPMVDPQKSAIYLGTVASAKLDKSAVKRNRMRRRCREAMRLFIKDAPKLPTVQLLVSPRSSSLHCDFVELTHDVSRFFSAL